MSVGIDTHEREHYVEIQNENEMTMWHGRMRNNREGFLFLLEKIRMVERSNSQDVMGIFINPTGNYHIPVRYFLEINGFGDRIFVVDARRTNHSRKIINLGKEKSVPEDARILAATPWHDHKYMERRGHRRDEISELTRMRDIVNKNITRISNCIHADLSVVFPEFTDVMAIDSKTGMAIQERFTTPQNICSVSTEEMFNVMKKEGRSHYSEEDAEALMELARNSIGVPDQKGVFTVRISISVRRLRDEMSILKDPEKQIVIMSSDNEDVKHLTEMNGIGVTNASSIVYEIGRIEQFKSSLKLQSYGGKCPDMNGSGGKSNAKGITKIRNEHLSNAVHESAISLVLHRNKEFYELFTREIRKGKTNTEAYIVVGKRLLFHVFSMMKNHRPYRERLYQGKRGRGSLQLEVENAL